MFVESLLVYGGLLDYSLIWFHPSVAIFKLPPQIWRFPTSFLLTGPKFAFIFDLYFTWLYSNALELNSPRFSRPGDYFTFITFVGTIIMVSSHFYPTIVCLSLQYNKIQHLTYLPAQHLIAEAVPGVEEEYPCGTCSSVIRKNCQGLYRGVGMVVAFLNRRAHDFFHLWKRFLPPTFPILPTPCRSSSPTTIPNTPNEYG